VTHIYTVRPSGSEWPDHFPDSGYRDEDELVEDLRRHNEKYGLPDDLVVHVYETDATRLGIGRKHVGTIAASTVLVMGEVDLSLVG
jgi:hypothetical protein